MSVDVDVRVRRLVLHDVDPRQRGAVIDALQAELTRLLAAQRPARGVARGDVEVHVDGHAEDPRMMGTMAAAAVHRELVR